MNIVLSSLIILWTIFHVIATTFIVDLLPEAAYYTTVEYIALPTCIVLCTLKHVSGLQMKLLKLQDSEEGKLVTDARSGVIESSVHFI